MAKTLLQGVNEVLKKVGILDNDGELTSLSDSARQTSIDLAVQVLNEIVDQVYESADLSKPNQLAERTITLNTGDRDYILHSSLIRLRTEYHLIDETNNDIIYLLNDDDGYRKIILGDIEQDDTGKPTYAAIRPTDGQLFLDRAPTSDYDGREYKYRFDADLSLSVVADTFPFTDGVFRAIVPASAELWKRYRQQSFDAAIFSGSIGRASRMMTKTPPRTSWTPVRSHASALDPLEP